MIKEEDIKSFYKDKTIVVTGGVGSIGSEIVRELLMYNPYAVRIFDNNETGLFELEQELQSNKIRPLVGDIRDKERLKRAFEGVDIVFHAAALKHVPLSEYNPFDAVKTNVIGTKNVLDIALEEEVEKTILVSTDKAVNPTNVMGATKLLAERLTVSTNYIKGDRKSVFLCVRFGNVLDSRGSVVPIFRKQIENGGPVTVTDKEMTRFVMSIPKAVRLILKAAFIGKGGDIFLLKMSVLRVMDLAEIMIEEFAPKYGCDPRNIKIKTIGKRSGEKLYEELMTEDETEYAYEDEEMIVLLPQILKTGMLAYNLFGEKPIGRNFKKAQKRAHSSKDVKLLNKDEIRSLLKELNHK